MTIGIGYDFWICLFLSGSFVHWNVFFSSGFLSVLVLCCLFFGLLSWCVHRECLLVLETGIWDELEEGKLE